MDGYTIGSLMTNPALEPRTEDRGLQLLVVIRHPTFIRLWDNVLRELLARGHHIHVACELERESSSWLDRLERDFAGQVSVGAAPLKKESWAPLLWTLRQTADYLRYLEPEYERAVKLRARAERGVPRTVVRLLRRGSFRPSRSRQLLLRALLALEGAIPPLREIVEYVEAAAPDAIFVTPLVSQHSQHDYVRAARELNIPSVYGVASWDNLTNKGLVHEKPDRTWVWNELQRAEAVRYHGLEPETVVVCGAHAFDQWFHWKPSASREELCRRAGVDPERPYLLYACSSSFVARDEAPAIERWLLALRASSRKELREVGVLVRPHPSTADRWLENPFTDLSDVTVFPLGSETATQRARDFADAGARETYFDSLYHATAVVGLNTSALIEAAILGKRCITFVTDETRATQDGTLHFAYLRTEHGGPLVVAEGMEPHLAHLEQALSTQPEPDWNKKFVTSFVRPHGLEFDAAPLVCDDLELFIPSFVPTPVRRLRFARPLLAILARWMDWRTDRPTRDPVVYGVDFRARVWKRGRHVSIVAARGAEPGR
jgi:hypothetical protein